jgi:EpsI family protein
MIVRAAVVIVMLVGAGMYAAPSDTEARVSREPLVAVPLRIGAWNGREARPFADDVLAQVGVDEYINRQYVGEGRVPIALYVGYYASQRQGDTIHSPRNCLPGAGWQSVEAGTLPLHAAARARDVAVNRYVVQKGLDRQVVLYWYQGRGRITASEYAAKAWLMLDAARLHRTNGGLVRVIAPVMSDTVRATADATAFAEAVLPYLSVHLP